MRQLLIGYTSRSPKDLKPLWDEAFIVLDTSALIDLHDLQEKDPKEAEETLAVLDELKERLWMPHQVALELLHDFDERRRKKREVFRSLQNHVDGLEKKLQSAGLVPTDRVQSACKEVAAFVEESEPNWESPTKFEAEVERLFDGHVGPMLSTDDFIQRSIRCQQRYDHKRPPGFCDEKKPENRYGDCLIWGQILDEARLRKQPVLLIINDRKDDWWLLGDYGKKIGPRPELIDEMRRLAGVDAHLYTLSAFIEQASSSKHHVSVAELVRIENENAHAERSRTLAIDFLAIQELFRTTTAASVGALLASFVAPPSLTQAFAESFAEFGRQQQRQIAELIQLPRVNLEGAASVLSTFNSQSLSDEDVLEDRRESEPPQEE